MNILVALILTVLSLNSFAGDSVGKPVVAVERTFTLNQSECEKQFRTRQPGGSRTSCTINERSDDPTELLVKGTKLEIPRSRNLNCAVSITSDKNGYTITFTPTLPDRIEDITTCVRDAFRAGSPMLNAVVSSVVYKPQ